MTLVKQIKYPIRDFLSPSSPESFASAQLKVHGEAPKCLVQRVLVIQNENKRQGNACSKTRSEVRGGGRKPWKQKGTGQARSGSSSSPLWRGGGVTFGPRTRTYRKKINIKEKQLAFTTGLHSVSDRVMIIKNFSFNSEKPSTKVLVSSLKKFDPNLLEKKVLILVSTINKNLALSSRNLSHLTVASRSTVSLRDVLLAESILIAEDALPNFTI